MVDLHWEDVLFIIALAFIITMVIAANFSGTCQIFGSVDAYWGYVPSHPPYYCIFRVVF